jgi:hypothetical protein
MDIKYFQQRILPYLLKTDINYPVGETNDGRTAYVLGYVPIGDYLDAIFFLAPQDNNHIRAKKKEMSLKFPIFELSKYPDMDIKWWDDDLAQSYIKKAIA